MSLRYAALLVLSANAVGSDLNVLNNNDSLADTIAEYSEAYTPRHTFLLQGILLTSNSWVIWVNNKEITDLSSRYIKLDDKVVEIVQVTPHSVTFKYGINNVTIGIGKSYDFKRGEFSDF
ncbi:MAG: hypothetical protein LBF66_03270 [Holosporales bacterium]|jgi:hypothetical protein|nr:hypothetical protein [Holosporales bacterium]